MDSFVAVCIFNAVELVLLLALLLINNKPQG